MNANLPLKTPAIKDWLDLAIRRLIEAGIESAKLDAEIILAHTIRKSRTFLHAHNEKALEPRQYEIANARLDLRLDRTPIAYIIGHKEFYGRLFRVSPATLIPRPESETLITLLKELVPKNLPLPVTAPKKLVDIGTGSGCLGITAKLELPELDVTLTDISRHALTVAERNAKDLQAAVKTLQSDLLSSYPLRADFIIANLPYVDSSWERSPETDHEPGIALFAQNDGLQLILKLLKQTPSHLATGGYLLLEADPRQHNAIIEAAKIRDLRHLNTDGFIVVLQKNVN
jgi:release factor glutamine methyltransferase